MHNTILIGLGGIGLRYDLELDNESIFTHSRALSRHSAYKLLAAVEPNKYARDVFENEYRVETFESIFCVPDLTAHQVAICVIAVPTELHKSILELSLKRFLNLKMVVCEKPIGCSSTEFFEMQAMCNEADIFLVPNYIRKGDKSFNILTDLLSCRSYVDGLVRFSGDLVSNASHYIDLVISIFGLRYKILLLTAGDERMDRIFQIIFPQASITFIPLSIRSHHSQLDLFTEGFRIQYDYSGQEISLNKFERHGGIIKLNQEIHEVFQDMKHYQLNMYTRFKSVFDGDSATYKRDLESAFHTQKILDYVARGVE